jgi:hypothetical protein
MKKDYQKYIIAGKWPSFRELTELLILNQIGGWMSCHVGEMERPLPGL